MADETVNPENVINVLVATDIHLGYNERDPIRGDDSFVAFEEILQTAQASEVDFLLLGGDLFHDTKPSPACLYRCIALLRRYCLGEREIKIEFLSDQSINFSHCSNATVNYEDPNLNVSIPVFSIHGNHDDPTGAAQLSALDILASMGLVNYFGKITNLEEVEVFPILLQKGLTKVALYGLSHIKDARLCRLFSNNKVTLMRPSEDDDWFSIMALHQNRADRGIQNYLRESMLPDFLNFVLWGHEHDCRIEPEETVGNGVQICQPGSSVATSLSKEESGRKYIGLLSINKTNFKFQKIQLKTVRPFLFQHTSLDEFERDKDSIKPISKQIEEFVQSEVDRLIIKSKELLTGHPKQPTLPLIRIRVQYENDEQNFNIIHFSHQYHDKIANPGDLVILKKVVKRTKGPKFLDNHFDLDQMEKSMEARVESKVLGYFDSITDPKKKLQVLTCQGMAQALIAYIDKNDQDAIELLMDLQIENTLKKCEEMGINSNNLDAQINDVVKERMEKLKEEEEQANALLNNPERVKKPAVEEEEDVEMATKSDDELVLPAKPARGRGKNSTSPTKKPTAAKGRGGRGKNITTNNTNSVIIEDSDDEEVYTPSTRNTRRGRTAGTATKATPAKQTPITSQYTPSRRAAAVGKNYVLDISDSD